MTGQIGAPKEILSTGPRVRRDATAAAVDVWSRERRYNQKQTCESISKSSTRDKVDHMERLKWYGHGEVGTFQESGNASTNDS